MAASERVKTIDVLRGFALFGILLVNIKFFANPVLDAFTIDKSSLSQLDYIVEWFTAFFGTGKFYPLFSFLFGLGFAVQLGRAETRGGRFKLTYFRRILLLLAIGVAHGMFIWAGDILTSYAFMGLMLLLLFMVKRGIERVISSPGKPRKISNVSALVLAAIFTLPATGIYVFAEQAEKLRAMEAEGVEIPAEMQGMQQQLEMQQKLFGDEAMAEARRVYSSGSFGEVAAQRQQDYTMMLQNLPFFGWFLLTMFLVGAFFGRRELITRVAEHKTAFRVLFLVSAVLGGWLSWQYTRLTFIVDPRVINREFADFVIINQYAGLCFALAYVSGISLLMQTAAAKVLGLLAPVGRMALSNYLLQSIVSTLVFYGYGLGMMAADWSSAQLLAYVVVLYLLQIPLSHWWMKRFAFGPAEWLWRSLTYLKLQPMRIAAN